MRGLKRYKAREGLSGKTYIMRKIFEYLNDHVFSRNKLVVITFLVPVTEDEEVGNVGEGHSEELWPILLLLLNKSFGGHTKLDGTLSGSWHDSQKDKTVHDVSREYQVDIKRKDITRMRKFLETVGIIYKQKCIRYIYDGEPRYAYSEKRWKAKGA